MASKKATKTVTMSKGMQDDADQFMLEPPATQLVINGDFTKPGVISKRKGLDKVTTATGVTGTPAALLSTKGNLVAVGNGESHVYDGSSWEADTFGTLKADTLGSIKSNNWVSRESVYTVGGFTYVGWVEVSLRAEADIVGVAEDLQHYLYYQVLNSSGDTIIPATQVGTAEVADFDFTDYNNEIYIISLSSDGTSVSSYKGAFGSTLTFDSTDTLGQTVYVDKALYDEAFVIAEATAGIRIPYSMVGKDICHFHATSAAAALLLSYGYDSGGGTIASRLEARNITTLAQTDFAEAATSIPYDAHVLNGEYAVLFYATNTTVFSLQSFTIPGLSLVKSITARPALVNSEHSIAGSVDYDGTKYTVAMSYDQYTDEAGRDMGGWATATPGMSPATPDARYQEIVTELVNVDDGMTTVSNQQILRGRRLVSKCQFISGKTVLGVADAYHSPTLLANNPPMYNNDWKTHYIISYAAGTVTIETVLAPNESYNVQQSQTVFYDHVSRIGGNGFILAKALSAANSEIRREDSATSTAANQPAPGSATLRLMDLNVATPTTISSGQQALISAGITYAYDGNKLVEQSPLGVPKIQYVFINGHLGQRVGAVNYIHSAGSSVFSFEKLWGSDSLEETKKTVIKARSVLGDTDPTLYTIGALKSVLVRRDAAGLEYRSAPSPTVYVPIFHEHEAGSGDDRFIIAAASLYVYTHTPMSVDDSVYYNEIYAATVETETGTVDDTFKLIGTSGINEGNSLLGMTCTVGNVDFAQQNVVLSTAAVTTPRSFLPAESKVLYTESGELPGDVISGVKDIAEFQSRLAVVLNSDEPTISISHRVESGEGARFPSAFRISFSEESSIKAMEGLDDKLLVFFEDAIYVVFGQGPDLLGNGQGWSVQKLPSTVGCLDAGSVVSVPPGIMFRGKRGFYLLDRALTLHRKGGVDNLIVGTTVRAAYSDDEKGVVVFTMEATGDVLDPFGPNYTVPDPDRPPVPFYGNGYVAGYAAVYDYVGDNWSIYTNHNFLSMVTYDGKLTGIRPDWSVYSPGTGYADTDYLIKDNLLEIKSAWIKFGNMQDFSSLRKVTLLGRYYSELDDDGSGALDAGDISVKVIPDYVSGPNLLGLTSTRWTASDMAVSVDGGILRAPQQLQLSVRPGRRKCQAVQLHIEEEITADAGGVTYRVGRGFEISAADLDLQLKGGSDRQPSGRKK